MRLAINALGSVPVFDVIFNAMGEIGATFFLALAEVFHGAESVCLHALSVFNNFLDDNGFGEAFLVALGVDGLGSAVEEALLAEAEGVSFGLARNFAVNIPIIITLALFTGSVVSMSLNVHLLVLGAFLERTSVRVKHSLSISAVLGGAAEGRVVTLSLNLLRPLIDTGDGLA